ncbi:HAD hydrolase, IA, variant 1 family protein [Candidatus Phytoplasma oryzae]|uniref:HAD hydrolase, IA, variant 1 family protein n=1 Tax=Candidatus Phytoplasma oryzae TaxID=203274 RepID=A0A139JQS9_9MOLU|nr:YqeG family HAD IIIA-type phosphatase [Candidatus Phytoplasma oryzae]KXT29319.1 HAD hydrolase, IA, variant 1 family protein [Candidatus Phytoplasma oryzae]RAM57874.1 haloacid dehalogenase [Candidatus Phytoplasma oryzae]
MKKKIIKYLPNFYYDSFLDIPYDFFFKKGIKALLFDLDNTLLSSEEKVLNDITQKKMKQIKEKFKIFILSNASKKKLKRVLNSDFFYIYLKWYQKKPSKYGFKKVLNLLNIDIHKVLMIGDQLRTDILGANKMRILSILVKPINKNKESFWTKLSRFLFEDPVIEYLKKNNNQIYNEKFKNFVK